jgi:serine phosphatase RsbU (regulator of sigma subunit)
MRLPNLEEILSAQQVKEPFMQKKTTNATNELQYAARSVLSPQMLTGDYYDFIPVGRGNLGLLIADIRGKVLPSYSLVARLRAFLEMQERYVLDDVRELTRKANEFFYHLSCPDEFASLFFGRYEGGSGRLSYVNCGHVPPLLVRSDGSARKLGFTGPVIGISENWSATIDEVDLQAGDTLVMVTDGITEAMDRTGEQFGYGRLLEVVRTCLRKKPGDLANAIIQAANAFSSCISRDDVTVVVARVKLDRQEQVRDPELCAVPVGA